MSDFNFDWRFQLDGSSPAYALDFDDNDWQPVRLPHDWAVELPYTKEGAASTGFKLGGIGWYRKSFTLDSADQEKQIWLEFDGIYNNAQVWINGRIIAERPYGYASFRADLTSHLNFGGAENVVAVKVDRTAFADSRWYTGSGIYRNVRLVKANDIHIPQWGVQITTPIVTNSRAEIAIKSEIETGKYIGKDVEINFLIKAPSGKVVATTKQALTLKAHSTITQSINVDDPQLWWSVMPHSSDTNMYQLTTQISLDGVLVESEATAFGIRSIKFDAKKGFLLNGVNTKIKGVNLHHDAGAVGAAVPRSVWRSRMERLKSVGVNAIRLSHNPHAPELLDIADEMGFLVNAEAFDDWDRAKGKNKDYIGDNKASGESVAPYNEHFNEWAERDAKDFVKRDFNHPSVIMWSIGNEIEWTYPYYPKAVSHVEDGTDYYNDAPDFDPSRIRAGLKKHNPDAVDNLPIVAKRLSGYIKEIDTTRPITAGLTHPSVGFASGYTDALDLVGFNYRAAAYEKAHETYPDKVIYGSENWGAWREWRDVKDKDYVSGIFIWTGFAYKGEAGPLPRMGLEISLFDYVGNKTPRGHFFEALWRDDPKMFVGTTAANKSEFSFSKQTGWKFSPRLPTPSYIWDKLRMWEWYDINATWRYEKGEQVVVQAYTNAEEAELFINGKSQGKQLLANFDDNIVKWMTPYERGELKVVGYKDGIAVSEDLLNTPSELAQIQLSSEQVQLTANRYDTTYLHAVLKDKMGNDLSESTVNVRFIIEGPAKRLVVDNGSENNLQDVLADTVDAYRGRAAMLLQSTSDKGMVKVTAEAGDVTSNPIWIMIQ